MKSVGKDKLGVLLLCLLLYCVDWDILEGDTPVENGRYKYSQVSVHLFYNCNTSRLTYTYVVYRGTSEANALYSDGWSSVFAEDES